MNYKESQIEIKYNPKADVIFLSVFVWIVLISGLVFLTSPGSWKAALFGVLFGGSAILWRTSQKVTVKDGMLISRVLFLKRKVRLVDIKKAKMGESNTYFETKFKSDVRVDIVPKASVKQKNFSINLYPFGSDDINKLLSILNIER